MKTILAILTLFVLVISCSFGQKNKQENKLYSDITDLNPSDTLFRIYKGELYELGVPSGYVNQKGDTVIPIGKYQYCFFDTVTIYAIVGDKSGFYAIDQKENRLYEVYWLDNGPDYIKDGLFRIKRNDKIGYANTKGEIVIEPQFDCANAFENEKARVTFDCELKKVGEHTEMKSDNWIYIDKTGKRIE
ncbi:MAG: WG repeat-containing protein [Balneola sp.]